MLRPTPLEERLGVHRTLLAMLIAHLEDNGLIDRAVLEADVRSVHTLAGDGEPAREELRRVFQVADVMIAGWEGQRLGGHE